jgi:hypothetical protein
MNIPYNFETDVKNIIKELVSKGGPAGAGSDYMPHTLSWCKCLNSGFKDTYNIIDWGCGYGRFLNYLLSKKIEKFKYYGFELRGENNGNVLINFCNKHYLKCNDSNKIIKFGFIDEDNIVNEAIKNCDILLLGSVFTHLNINDSINILKKFDNFITDGGKVVFSLITEKNIYKEIGPNCYNNDNNIQTFGVVFHSDNEINLLNCNNRYKISLINIFETDHDIKHNIYSLKYNLK